MADESKIINIEVTAGEVSVKVSFDRGAWNLDKALAWSGAEALKLLEAAKKETPK